MLTSNQPGCSGSRERIENGFNFRVFIEYLMNKAIAEGRTKPTDFPSTCPPWAEAEAFTLRK